MPPQAARACPPLSNGAPGGITTWFKVTMDTEEYGKALFERAKAISERKKYLFEVFKFLSWLFILLFSVFSASVSTGKLFGIIPCSDFASNLQSQQYAITCSEALISKKALINMFILAFTMFACLCMLALDVMKHFSDKFNSLKSDTTCEKDIYAETATTNTIDFETVRKLSFSILLQCSALIYTVYSFIMTLSPEIVSIFINAIRPGERSLEIMLK